MIERRGNEVILNGVTFPKKIEVKSIFRELFFYDIEKIIDVMAIIKSATKINTFAEALEMVTFSFGELIDEEGERDIMEVLDIYRISKDGGLDPPVDFELVYGSVCQYNDKA